MNDKVRLLFIPYLVILFCFIIGYTFIHYVLFIQLETSLKENVINFWIPVILAGIAALFILRPRLKMLDLRSKRNSWKDFYTFVAWLALTVPFIMAQEYIVTATGKLTEINSVNEINERGATKYYAIKEYYADNITVGVHVDFDISGRNNDNLNMHLYVASPIFNDSAEIHKVNAPKAWLGVKYDKTISNRLEPNQKEEQYKQFVEQSQNDFKLKDLHSFSYFDRIGPSDAKDGFLEAVRKDFLFISGGPVIVGINEPFGSRNGSKLGWILGSLLAGSILWLLMILSRRIDAEQLAKLKNKQHDDEAIQERREMLNILLPHEGYFITPILIYANLAVFLFMVVKGLGIVSFKSADLLVLGANYGPITKSGEWWRLLTNIFLHGGLMHIFANMYGLLFVGILLEPVLGRLKYLLAYLITGIIASIASLWWYDATISVGASGAIFGLYGVFLALLLTKVFPPELGKGFLASTLVFVGYNLLMGLIGNGIDNAAHIGGLASGFLIGVIIYPRLKVKIVAAENEFEESHDDLEYHDGIHK